ncbi:MAG: hypothetical protein KH359_00145 [Clostridiales bacterium]|nr:hypothetical protein [Clostridiales bacterium]
MTIKAMAEITLVRVNDGESIPGPPGSDGKGIKSITEHYMLSTVNSGITTGNSGWSTVVPTMTSTKKYLWNYEKVTYTDNTSLSTTPKVIGVYGDKGAAGNGIKSIMNYYLATTAKSGVTTSTQGWTIEIQTMTSTKKYLWNYEVVTYTNGSKYTSAPCIIGVYGDKGATGEAGTSGIIVSDTAPSNPKVGQLWQRASGQPIQRWDGKKWTLHYISVDNLDVETLSAISANLGTVTAGVIKNAKNLMNIDLSNGTVSSSDANEKFTAVMKAGEIDLKGQNSAGEDTGTHIDGNGIRASVYAKTVDMYPVQSIINGKETGDMNIQPIGLSSLPLYETLLNSSYEIIQNSNSVAMKYANGLLLCAGHTSFAATTAITAKADVVFPVPFKDAGYYFVSNVQRNGSIVTSYWEGDVGGNNIRTSAKTSISHSKTNGNYGIAYNWFAIGFWK